jgi:hypothetical protein
LKRDLKAQSATTTLRQWKDGGAIEEFASFSGPWCVGHGVVTYVLKYEREAGKAKRTTFAVGEPGKTAEAVIEFDDALKFPQLMHTASRGGGPFSTDPRRQSPFDCRWVKNETLTGGKKDAEWIPLMPEDGFLSFVKKGSTEKILYYSSETSASIELPVFAQNIEPHSVRYYAYKRAYFLSATESPQSSAEKNSNCALVWWFYPKEARTEPVCAPVDEIAQNYPTYWPSRAGLLRVISARRTAHGEKPGGIYLTSEDGKSEKIYEGNVRAVSVSPDGCRVAIALYPRSLDPKAALSVLELCSMSNSPSAEKLQ